MNMDWTSTLDSSAIREFWCVQLAEIIGRRGRLVVRLGYSALCALGIFALLSSADHILGIVLAIAVLLAVLAGIWLSPYLPLTYLDSKVACEQGKARQNKLDILTARYTLPASPEAVCSALPALLASLGTLTPGAPFTGKDLPAAYKAYSFFPSVRQLALLLVTEVSPLPQGQTAITLAGVSIQGTAFETCAQKALDKCVAALSGQFGQP